MSMSGATKPGGQIREMIRVWAIVLRWMKRHWLEIVVCVAVLAFGIFIGVKMSGCSRKIQPVPTPEVVDPKTEELVKEVNDLLREIEQRQSERRRAAEGLK